MEAEREAEAVAEKTMLSRCEKAAILVVAFFILTPLAILPAKRSIEGYRNVTNNHGAEPWHSYEWATLGVLIFQAWIYYRQARLMERQADISDRQVKIIEASERALLLVQTFRWTVEGWGRQSDKSLFPGVVVSLANFGSEVALADYCRIGLFIGTKPPELRAAVGQQAIARIGDDKGLRTECYTSYFMIRRGIMPSSDEWEIPVGERILTPPQIDELVTGHQKVWIDAVAFYSDIRGGRHETYFRYVYDPQADMFIPDESAPVYNRHT